MRVRTKKNRSENEERKIRDPGEMVERDKRHGKRNKEGKKRGK
jgi:hypothetical protein